MENETPIVELQDVSRAVPWPSEHLENLDKVSLKIQRGSFTSIVGEVGSGKSAVLRLIEGRLSPEKGRVVWAGRSTTQLTDKPIGVATLFSRYALMPHLTIVENVAMPLRIRGVDPETATARALNALELLHLAEVSNRYPRQLSGGQRHRAAIARMLVTEPEIIMLDNPFEDLNPDQRVEVLKELRALQRNSNTTVVLSTEALPEAMAVSDRIAVMEGGHIESVRDVNDEFLVSPRGQELTRAKLQVASSASFLDRMIVVLEIYIRREPVGCSVIAGLLSGAATGSFSGFIVGVTGAGLVAYSVRAGRAR